MSNETQEVKIVGVDKEMIKASSDKNSFWIIPFKLSRKPDDAWERKFYEVQQKDNNILKRNARISQGFLNVEANEMDDIQKVLDVINVEITETNVLCEDDYQKKLKVRQELENLQKKRENITQKFKDDADSLKF